MVPTSTSRAPDCAITSGTRNDPPISTLSPRLTGTSRPAASAATTSSTAAALLLTTIADSAPHSVASSWPTAACRDPRSPVAQVELDRLCAATTGIGERRAAEVGVQQHAGRVHDRGQQLRR